MLFLNIALKRSKLKGGPPPMWEKVQGTVKKGIPNGVDEKLQTGSLLEILPFAITAALAR